MAGNEYWSLIATFTRERNYWVTMIDNFIPDPNHLDGLTEDQSRDDMTRAKKAVALHKERSERMGYTAADFYWLIRKSA